MAKQKTETILDNFNQEILSIALTKIDKNQLATQLAKALQARLQSSTISIIKQNIDIDKLIKKELFGSNSKVSRNLQATISEITQEMVETIRNPKKQDT